MKKKKTTGEYQEDMRGREDEDILNAREEEAAPTEDVPESTREPEFPKKRQSKTDGRGRKERTGSDEEELAA